MIFCSEYEWGYPMKILAVSAKFAIFALNGQQLLNRYDNPHLMIFNKEETSGGNIRDGSRKIVLRAAYY